MQFSAITKTEIFKFHKFPFDDRVGATLPTKKYISLGKPIVNMKKKKKKKIQTSTNEDLFIWASFPHGSDNSNFVSFEDI